MNIHQQATIGMPESRKIAIAAGLCYLITHVTSVSARLLYDPILNNAGYILGAGPDTPVLVGAVCEVILALAIIGTAVALFPVVKRQNEGIALGYVGLRTLEAGIIAIGVVPLLTVVTLRQHLAEIGGTDPGMLVALGTALVVINYWTFLVGPGLVCGANTVLMAYLMYRSRLVPRFTSMLGLIGGPLVFAYNTGLMFGFGPQISAWAGLAVIPVFAWELTLAIRLITKGFNPPAAAPTPAQPGTNEFVSAV